MSRKSTLRTVRKQICTLYVVLLLALLATVSPVLAQSTVWTWGRNQEGQLGDGTTTNRSVPQQVVNADGSLFTNVIAIVAGYSHTVALKRDGTVWAWGSNQVGQLGDGTQTRRLTPMQVKGPGGSGFLTGVIMIAARGSSTFALKTDGRVWIWGNNRLTPELVRGPGGMGFLTDIVAINTDIALKSNGASYRVTDGIAAQISNPSGTGFLTDVVAAGGGGHSIALKADSTVWTWGNNIYGQLGDNTRTDRARPVQVVNFDRSSFTGVRAVVVGSNHTMALMASNGMRAWGHNLYHQLGIGLIWYDIVWQITPSGISISNVAGMAAGYDHSLAVKFDGTVWGWGRTNYGQTPPNWEIGNSPTPLQVENLSNIVAVAAGNEHSVALQMPGTLPSGVLLDNYRYLDAPFRFEFRPVAGGDPVILTRPGGPSGLYTFSNIPVGTYNVAVKGSKWLQKVLPNVVVTSTNVLNLRVSNLVVGDANNDNSIDVLDLAWLIQAFDSDPSAPHWDTNADFNGDESVDVLDLDVLIRNFDLQGDP